MSYYVAGEYFARKRVNIATARAQQYWAHPRTERNRWRRRLAPVAAGGRALLHAVVVAPLRIEGRVVSRGWLAETAHRRAG